MQGFQNTISLPAIITNSLCSWFSYWHRNFQFRGDSNHHIRKAACVSSLGLDCPAMCSVSGWWNMQNTLILHKPMKKSQPFQRDYWQSRLNVMVCLSLTTRWSRLAYWKPQYQNESKLSSMHFVPWNLNELLTGHLISLWFQDRAGK